MRSHLAVAFLVLVLSQANHGEESKVTFKPEKGKEECEHYLSRKNPAGVWGMAWNDDCKLDSQNRTIKEKARHRYSLKGLYDPCCTEYMGLVCRQIYNEKKGNGYCGKPDPYQEDGGFGRDDFLSLMKKKKIADGQQLDNRWKYVD